MAEEEDVRGTHLDCSCAEALFYFLSTNLFLSVQKHYDFLVTAVWGFLPHPHPWSLEKMRVPWWRCSFVTNTFLRSKFWPVLSAYAQHPTWGLAHKRKCLLINEQINVQSFLYTSIFLDSLSLVYSMMGEMKNETSACTGFRPQPVK